MDILCCPACKGDLALAVDREDAGQILEGTLRCGKCRRGYPIQDGIPTLLPES